MKIHITISDTLYRRIVGVSRTKNITMTEYVNNVLDVNTPNQNKGRDMSNEVNEYLLGKPLPKE